MNIQRSHIFGFIGLVAFAFALYWAKAEAQTAREQVLSLQTEVEKERRSVRTLEAELAWMERPDRLEATARQNMGLTPSTAEKTLSLNEIDQVAPLPAANAPTLVPSVEPQKEAVQ